MSLSRSVSYHDLRFTRVPVMCYGSRGSSYLRWIDAGMPIIPPSILHCSFYLYKDRKSAEAGEDAGGTGFLVTLHGSDGIAHQYGVTNYHVAVGRGFSCVRINTVDGGTEVFEFGPDDWRFEPGGDDVAIVPLSLEQNKHIATFIGPNLVLSPQTVLENLIGPGDDVFMVGKFVDLGVRERNMPSVRFGNISSSPVPIRQPNGCVGDCFTIDMHSRTGFSGSPVLVYRTPGNTLEWAMTGGPVVIGGKSKTLLCLLGVHCGQFPEQMPIIKKARPGKKLAVGDLQHDEYVEGLSGMTIVVPAWRILELLQRADFISEREQVEAMRKINKRTQPPEVKPEVAEDGDAAARFDDALRRMLVTPPQPKPSKRTPAKKARSA